MSSFKPPYQYVIDSSALFDLKDTYPESIFPAVWERFNEMCDEKKIIAPREVLREIQKGNDDLVQWAEKYEDIFIEPVDDESKVVQSVMDYYSEPEKEKHYGKNWADPLVVACAKHYGLPIIQHESPNAQYKIPAVANKFGVKCFNLIEFFKEENWIF